MSHANPQDRGRQPRSADVLARHEPQEHSPQKNQPSELHPFPAEVFLLILEYVVVYDRVLFLRIKPNSSRPGKRNYLSKSDCQETDGKYVNLYPFDIEAPPVCKALHELYMQVFLEKNTFGFRKIRRFNEFTYWLGQERCKDLRQVLLSGESFHAEVACHPFAASWFMEKVDFPARYQPDRGHKLDWSPVVVRWKDKITEIPYVEIGRTPKLTSFEIAIHLNDIQILYGSLRGYNGPWRQRLEALKDSLDADPTLSMDWGVYENPPTLPPRF